MTGRWAELKSSWDMKIGPWHQPLLVKKSLIDLLKRPVSSKAPVSPKLPVGTRHHRHQMHSRTELIIRECLMCVQGIVVEAIWKPLSFSIHCSDAVLQATSSQGRQSFQEGLKQLMLMHCLLLVCLCFNRKYESKVRSRILQMSEKTAAQMEERSLSWCGFSVS